MFSIETVSSFTGRILEEALYVPQTSLIHPTPQYSVVLELDEPWLQDEIELLFEQETYGHQEIVHKWKAADGIRFTSIVKPRCPSDLGLYEACCVRARPSISGEADQVCALTLVAVQNVVEELMIDWLPPQFSRVERVKTKRLIR